MQIGICYFLKKKPAFEQFLLSLLFINKSLRISNLKTRTAMNVKISAFVICVEVIIYLLLYNLHDCTLSQRCLISTHIIFKGTLMQV